MGRPSQVDERREELLPVVARAFAEFGFRRTTTAELAERCGIRENVLYRLWPDKKAMFIAAIEHVYRISANVWQTHLHEGNSDGTPAERLLQYQAQHHGELGLYRLVFAGLSEADDPEIRAALKKMYGRFHRFISRQITDHRGLDAKAVPADVELAAWGIVGLGTVANVGQELGLISKRRRRRLMADVGQLLLEQ